MDSKANHISTLTIIFYSKTYSIACIKRKREIKKQLKKGYTLAKDLCSGNDAIGYTSTLTFKS